MLFALVGFHAGDSFRMPVQGAPVPRDPALALPILGCPRGIAAFAQDGIPTDSFSRELSAPDLLIGATFGAEDLVEELGLLTDWLLFCPPAVGEVTGLVQSLPPLWLPLLGERPALNFECARFQLLVPSLVSDALLPQNGLEDFFSICA